MSMFNLCLRVKNDRKIIYKKGLENSVRKHGGDMYEKDTIEVRQCYSGCECFYTALYMLAPMHKSLNMRQAVRELLLKEPKHEIFVAEFFYTIQT